MVQPLQFPGTPAAPLDLYRLPVRRRINKWLIHKDIDRMNASGCRVFLEAGNHFSPQLSRDIVEYPAGKHNVEGSVWSVIQHIRLKEINLYPVPLCQTARLVNPCLCGVEGSNKIAVFCKKNRILPLPAADLQNPVRFYGRLDFHNLIAQLVWLQPPVICLIPIPFFIVCHGRSAVP